MKALSSTISHFATLDYNPNPMVVLLNARKSVLVVR